MPERIDCTAWGCPLREYCLARRTLEHQAEYVWQKKGWDALVKEVVAKLGAICQRKGELQNALLSVEPTIVKER